MTCLRFEVYGVPEAMPRPRAVRRGLHAGVYQVKPTWMGIVALRAQEVRRETGMAAPLTGPVRLVLDFRMRRPASAPKRKERPHIGRPDCSNLAKAVEDAIVPSLLADDAQIVRLEVKKRYALEGESPGCRVVVEEAGAG